ncbi:hypothetical protein CVT24_004567 [Panaeolus cyanescens]|uniref:F-box domain-containing protein n=1 Tax=Panaeolus cyanescens TaxID=181874 RepID=A0A409VA35_9AGAR|nr:hypothetical protein CVT24_004567 [Panaeolus cyanescens]
MLKVYSIFVDVLQLQISSKEDHSTQPVNLPPEIWHEIFQFATYVHSSASIKPLDPFSPRRAITNAMGTNSYSMSMRTKRSLVLVSRSWRQLSMPIFYEHIVIRSPSRAAKTLQVLEGSKRIMDPTMSHTESERLGYGQWTRHLEIHTYARGSKEIEFLKTIFRIMRCCPNLRFLSGIWIHQLPLEFLAVITQLYASSELFSGLYWNDLNPKDFTDAASSTFSTTSSPEFLASFQSLRILDLRHFVGGDPVHRDPSLSSPTLPHVQDLVLSTYPRSMQAATILNLPSLRNLTLRTPDWKTGHEPVLKEFLKRHGSSLLMIDLLSPSPDNEPDPDTTISRRTATHINPDIFVREDLCPNLDTFVYPITSPQMTSSSHPKLRRIGLRGVRSDGLYPDKPSGTKDHLMSITSERYSNLELVQTISFLVDSDGDSLSKDLFIWWTERFEADGIDFRDGEGVLWAYTEPAEQSKAQTTEVEPQVVEAKQNAEGLNPPKDVETTVITVADIVDSVSGP